MSDSARTGGARILLDGVTKRYGEGSAPAVDNISMEIPAGEIVMLVVEVGPGRYKVSLRSRGEFSVHSIASHFDGGGHAKAAGCRLEGTEEQILSRLLTECRKTLGVGGAV